MFYLIEFECLFNALCSGKKKEENTTKYAKIDLHKHDKVIENIEKIHEIKRTFDTRLCG